MKKIRLLFRRVRSSRGSALLVSLMVIVGLSLLGLGFVAISETESAIAKNQSQALQTQAIAEAGAKLIVEWIQDPQWGMDHAAMPANVPCAAYGTSPCSPNGSPGVYIKTVRTSGAYTGVYKPKNGTKLLDRPYRPGNDDRLFGDEDHADLIINRITDSTTLDNFNNIVLGTNVSDKMAGEITEIKIFAPPVVGGVLTNGFWVGGQRYGVATIKVTAQQFRNPSSHTGVMASHAVRIVVGELPLPIPAGPIQGDANVSFGGNFRVHWGMETSRGDLTPSLSLSSLPWTNAYERPHFEHGYEQGNSIAGVTITYGGSGYTSAPTITIAPPPAGGTQATATATVTNGLLTRITMTNRGSGYPMCSGLPAPSAQPPTVTISGPGTGATATAVVAAETWPITGGNYDSFDYFHELLAKNFDDPWYGCRAVGDNAMDGLGTPYDVDPQCYPYAITAQERSTANPSYAFQWQDMNAYPLKKKVTFPSIRYDYWKRITQQGRGYKGIYYFAYDSGSGGFKKFNQGAAQPMAQWVNTIGNNLGPGVYFFDSATSQNPQLLAGAPRQAALTPAQTWNSSDFGLGGAPTFLMQGFVYMNMQQFGTFGQGNNATTVQANFPGEPFRDVGYPIWDTTANAWQDCNGVPCRAGAGDGVFSCQDLNGNGKCDIVVMQAPTWDSNDPTITTHTSPYTMPACGSGCAVGQTTYIPKIWKSNAQAQADYGAPCTIPAANYDGTNAAATDCSEPHEPYVNLVYPDQAANNNGQPYQVVVGWEPPGSQTYRPKRLDSSGAPVSCSGVPSPDDCVSNAYDVDGAVVPLGVILYGILYNEGAWGSQGNSWFYGSVLIQDNINNSAGTADVWFDEKLLKGTWAPPKMPRVIVFSEQTDEQSQ